MSSASRFGLGAQRHMISVTESYRRQASGGKTLLEQAVNVKKKENGDSSGPMILHKHDHADTHTHHHYPGDEHGEPDGDEMEVVRKPKPETEGRRAR